MRKAQSVFFFLALCLVVGLRIYDSGARAYQLHIAGIARQPAGHALPTAARSSSSALARASHLQVNWTALAKAASHR